MQVCKIQNTFKYVKIIIAPPINLLTITHLNGKRQLSLKHHVSLFSQQGREGGCLHTIFLNAEVDENSLQKSDPVLVITETQTGKPEVKFF